ncbi:A/G-specific adenine glycosylase [Alkalibacter rhizosphaerae]|uniref:Adenine DNA glycosylase n=2 Tax=Alkalibacter rhizosphaerae TaxID=2815577 RepID=A0A974XGV6_9FIRM|nr:A/G-specific adenine glycosylase [Alkalibacter rhizosphaerae]
MQLVAWYKNNARRLPWRDDPAPYKTWISEIMLQQTKVDTVIPYFKRFMDELPDVDSLASVDQDRLFKLWEGLGYYTRCKNLKKAAQIVMQRYGGELPDDYASLLSLPGIGPYTAGAVASISFGLPTPAIDGNVLRVISRRYGIKENIGKIAVKRKIESLVLDMMPKNEPGTFNQSLMELGAQVCIPNGKPLCQACPWESSCISYKNGWIDEIPYKDKKKPRRTEAKTILVVVSNNLVAIQQRIEGGLLSGMWEFPNTEGKMEDGQVQEWGGKNSLHTVSVVPMGEAKHLFSHVEWHMIGYLVEVNDPVHVPGWQWATLEDLEHRFALPSALDHYKSMILK